MKASELIPLLEKNGHPDGKIKVPDIAFIHIFTGPAPTTPEWPPEGKLLLTTVLDLRTLNA